MNELTQQTQPPALTPEAQLRQTLAQLQQYLTAPSDTVPVDNILAYAMGLVKQHPQLADILMPSEIGVMVASLRQYYAVTQIKGTTSTRAKKGTKAVKPANELTADDVANAFAAFMP